ncbi:MAG: hypothetical protein ABI625_02080 [bacterium]
MKIRNGVIALSLVAAPGMGNHAVPAPIAPQTVEIVGLDYAFQVPTKIAAGRTTFHFVNKGTVSHELNISLLKRGATVQQFMSAVNADTPTGAYREAPVGVLFADKGKRASVGLTTDLLPGRTYVIICINQDSTKAKKHFSMGMFSAINVPPTASPPPPPLAHVDTIVGSEYAFQYARTVAPGRHYFAFRNAGKVRHEFDMFLLKKGVTLEQVAKVEKEGGDVDALIEESIGVLHSPAGTSPLGLLDVDLKPGRDYTIVCSFSNDAKSPPHFALGMVGSIHVTGAAAK